MRQDFIEDDEEIERGPSKSQLKREQLELQELGREMTKLGDDQLKRIHLPEDVLAEIIEFRRMRSFGAQRRQLQLIGKKMRNMDPKAVREAIDRATGESRAAVALLHRCETLRDKMIEGDDAVKKFIDEHPETDIQALRTLVRGARKERELQKPPKNARELYRFLHATLEEPLELFREEEEDDEKRLITDKDIGHETAPQNGKRTDSRARLGLRPREPRRLSRRRDSRARSLDAKGREESPHDSQAPHPRRALRH